jgi:uncharacterized membrane protein
MRASANIAGHPIHPLIVTIPIGLWSFALVADIMYLWRENPAWIWVAYYCLGAGCLVAILAAVVGMIDLFGVKDKGAFHAGSIHAAVNVVALIVFAVDFYMRTGHGPNIPAPSSRVPFALSIVGVALILVSGWLGGELVYRYGLAVNDRHDGLPRDAEGQSE